MQSPDLWPLATNCASVVACSNSVQNLSENEQSEVELLMISMLLPFNFKGFNFIRAGSRGYVDQTVPNLETYDHLRPSTNPLGFRYIAPSRNQIPLKAKFCTIFAPCKNGTGIHKSHLVKSSVPLLHVSDLWYVALFWSQSTSKATGVENRGHILLFFPVKIRGGVVEISERILPVWHRTNVWYTFNEALFVCLGD